MLVALAIVGMIYTGIKFLVYLVKNNGLDFDALFMYLLFFWISCIS